jgi:hypothetical protein
VSLLKTELSDIDIVDVRSAAEVLRELALHAVADGDL